MTKLETLIARAQTDLPPEAQERLAELLDSYLATHTGPPEFSPGELERLRLLDREPFDPAPPEDVAALFARRG